jgi:peptidoglycan/xylan/chitin deacetylase (PgdA/CDA1 family)
LVIDGSFKLAGLALWLAGWAAPGWCLVVAFAAVPWLVWQLLAPQGRLFGPVVTSFATDRREVWLTLDDGPDPATTPAVLELLARHGARATFFLIGGHLARCPELARQIDRAGHAMGNHTFRHRGLSFWCAGPHRIAREIDRCAEAARQAGVALAPWFRPPVGMKNPFLQAQLAPRGLALVLWNARGFDGTGRDARAALARIVPQIRPGAILLAHEGGRNAASRLEFVTLLLEHLTREGYACILPSPEKFVRLG